MGGYGGKQRSGKNWDLGRVNVIKIHCIKFSKEKKKLKIGKKGVAVHTFNPSLWKAKAKGSL